MYTSVYTVDTTSYTSVYQLRQIATPYTSVYTIDTNWHPVY